MIKQKNFIWMHWQNCRHKTVYEKIQNSEGFFLRSFLFCTISRDVMWTYKKNCKRTRLCGQWGKVGGFIHMGNAENMGFPHGCSHYPQLYTGEFVDKRRTNAFFVEIWKCQKSAILFFEKKYQMFINGIMETDFWKFHKLFYGYWQQKKFENL